jgi:hypothetical protein
VTTTRRVTLEARLHSAPVSPVTVNRDGIGLAFDTTLTVGARRARLITWVDGDGDYAALSVGDVSGAHDVPVRAVDEEVLLIEGSHSVLATETLITTPVGAAGRRVVDSQLCIGGPVRDMLTLKVFR